MIMAIPPVYLMMVPNLAIMPEIFPMPSPAPIIPAAKGIPYPNEKANNINSPQIKLPLTKEAASTIGKNGLQQRLHADDKPPTVNPKRMAENKFPS